MRINLGFGDVGAIACLSLFALLAGGCGSGGGGDTGSPAIGALSLPDRIELSRVDDNGGGATNSLIGLAGLTSTDYDDATVHTWLRDTDALDLVNDILTAVHETRYGDFINAGPYRALVAQVGDDNSSGGDGQQATSTDGAGLMEMTVDVTRASPTAPMIVRIWVREDGDDRDPGQLIRGHFVVREGVSTDKPFGDLDAHFAGSALDENGDEIPDSVAFQLGMSISASDGQVVVEYVEEDSHEEQGETNQSNREVRVVAAADMHSGTARVHSVDQRSQGQIEEQTALFAFNADHFRMQETGPGGDRVFDKHQLRRIIRRYGLFDASEFSRVDLNGGFPIRFPSGAFGYVGQQGLWAPNGVNPTSGMQVTRQDDGAHYTLVVVPGRLTEHRRSETTLGEMVGVELMVFREGVDHVVIWNGTAFQSIGQRDQGSGQIEYTSPTTFTFTNAWEGGWCESLRAWIRLGSVAPDNTSLVYFHTERNVDPALAEDMTLYSFQFALAVPITQSVIDGANQARSSYYNNPPARSTWFFGSSDLLLRGTDAGGAPVVLGNELNLRNSEFERGYYLSPLTTSTNFNSSNAWEIHDADIYYSWATGRDEWNRFASVRNGAGQFEQFDEPIRMPYIHSVENDANGESNYDGRRFMLEYDGHELRLPWVQNQDTREWEPAIHLSDGTVLTSNDEPPAQFVVKGLDVELQMLEVTDSGALAAIRDALPIDTGIGAPTFTFDPSRVALVGAVPTNAELKVVRGERVDGN